MNDIGEPDEGKPHVRFDEGEQGQPSGLLWRDDYALYPKGGDKARRCLCWLGDNQTCSLLCVGCVYEAHQRNQRNPVRQDKPD